MMINVLYEKFQGELQIFLVGLEIFRMNNQQGD